MDSDTEYRAEDEDDMFMSVLEKHPILLAKSNTPMMKKRKETAIQNMCEELECVFGKKFEINKTMKKIANMKARVKAKADRNRTGNHRIKLTSWETKLTRLIDAHSNPSVCQTPGAASAGLGTDLVRQSPANSMTTVVASVSTTPVPDGRKTFSRSVEAPRKRRLSGETEETAKLSTIELQRLVLLEQLHYIRYKRHILESTVNRNPLSSGCENQPNEIYTVL